nr:dockerin type I repeat-containing protein [uncultured Ruminococcus sp.]
MKNSIKKLISILLAVILLASVFTVLPISAGAEETVAPTVLGDVDGDGDVTILDATLIRRYEVQLGTLSDQQQLAADVDGDGKVTILDATWIQRYLISLKAPDGIGKPMSEVYTVKAVPVLRESVDSTETAQVRKRFLRPLLSAGYRPDRGHDHDPKRRRVHPHQYRRCFRDL